MTQDQMLNQLAVQQAAALGVAGMPNSSPMGYGGLGNPSLGQLLGAMRHAPGTSSVINEMRADVRKWLSDWDK